MKVLTAAVLVVLVAFVSSNVVQRGEQDCLCPRHMDPVCASNSTHINTYNNDCLLECAKTYWKSQNIEMVVVKKGRCDGQ